MKISDLPKLSRAAKLLRTMNRVAARERLRCAEEAYAVAKFSYLTYKDEPGQWIRCEQVLRSILKDNLLTIEWLLENESRVLRAGK